MSVVNYIYVFSQKKQKKKRNECKSKCSTARQMKSRTTDHDTKKKRKLFINENLKPQIDMWTVLIIICWAFSTHHHHNDRPCSQSYFQHHNAKKKKTINNCLNSTSKSISVRAYNQKWQAGWEKLKNAEKDKRTCIIFLARRFMCVWKIYCLAKTTFTITGSNTFGSTQHFIYFPELTQFAKQYT